MPQTRKTQMENKAAFKIQSHARTRLAKRQRARHAARVGSIRDSGRAAAEDLRALSRPCTAPTVPATTAVNKYFDTVHDGVSPTMTTNPESGYVLDGAAAGVLEMAAMMAVHSAQPPPSPAINAGRQFSGKKGAERAKKG